MGSIRTWKLPYVIITVGESVSYLTGAKDEKESEVFFTIKGRRIKTLLVKAGNLLYVIQQQ